MYTTLGYALALGQFVAVLVIMIIGPNMLLAFIRAIRFEGSRVIWHSYVYYALILSIFFLMIVGIPKF